jgi:hypothetical protein
MGFFKSGWNREVGFSPFFFISVSERLGARQVNVTFWKSLQKGMMNITITF